MAFASRLRFLALAALALGGAPARGDDAASPTPLKVLFLGDRGHHVPAQRAAQLIPVLETRGMAVTYSEDAADLNPQNLARYDALVIYANTEKIEPAQEAALLDYVRGGGGFVPIHCASFCFLNSPKYVALVGAQFKSHGTGTFDVKVVDADHPITRGLNLFTTWDETYVHSRHNEEGRHVLETRAEGDREEPWTWTRDEGKGRVFYTAYGHDARTFGHPGFQDLVERGIRWAAHKGEVFDSRPRVAAGLKPFEYEPAEIPNYAPGKSWGTMGEAIKKMQLPLEPVESAKHLALPSGFEAKLFAADPEIYKPITMAWDHRGRLWVAETVDYPNELHTPGPGHDQIRILEDTDGDGRADKFTLFADKLSIPTSMAFADGGVVVHMAPDTLFFKDTDGDDKADVRKVLFTGWGTRDTHAGPSNLRYGHDNWMYGIVGYSGFEGTVGGERHRFGQGLYRFRPDGSKMEYLRGTNNNSWGVGLSEEGLVFGSTANGCASVFLPIPNRYYEGVRGWTSSVLPNIADSNRFFPVTENVRQVDWHGGFTAAAGHALYTARNYPRPYWNAAAFVAEPTGHLISTFTLEKRGSDFASHNGWNLVASDDEWTSPILAEVGPDGNVWFVDWYNFIVQHNPTPKGYKTGKGGAYEIPYRDKTHGRIYRVTHKDAPQPAAPIKALDPADPKGLVAALKSDNMFWRLHAQRLLIERGKDDVVADLVALVQDKSVDGIGLNPGAIHALWAMDGLGVLKKDGPAKEAVFAALQHPSAGVRRNAAMVLPRAEEADPVARAANLLGDPDPQVRLAAMLALADQPASDAAADAIVKALFAGMLKGDKWLVDAATAAAARNDAKFLERLATPGFVTNPFLDHSLGDRKPLVVSGGPLKDFKPENAIKPGAPIPLPPLDPAVAALAGRVAEHYARGVEAGSSGAILAKLAEADPRVAEAVISGFARGWPKDKAPKLDEASEKAMAALMTRLSPGSRARLIDLAGRWGSKSLEANAAEIAQAFLATVRDEKQTDAARVDAARRLVEFRIKDDATVETLLSLLSPRTPPALAVGLVEAVGRGEAAGAAPALLSRIPAMSPAVRDQAITALLGRAEWANALLDAIEKGDVSLTQLSLPQSQKLAAFPDRSIARRARAVVAKGGAMPDADRQKVIDEVAKVALKGGDVAKGKAAFVQQCAKCHMHSGEGGKVGPDLSGMASHPREELLIHILDPSRSVEGNFVQYTLATDDGRVLNGLLASETKNAIELLDAEGKTTNVLRENVEEFAASKKSLMPEGFEKQLGNEGMADLLAFLTQRGKYLPLDLAKVADVVTTRGMFFDPDSSIERLVFPDWTPKTFEGVPFVLVDPRGDRIPNAVMLYGPNGTNAPKMPKSVTIPCDLPARAIHLLSGISGWGATGPDGDHTVSMIVRLHYADGKTQDIPLKDGVHFADYIRPIEVPGSKLAFRLRGKQVRYLSVQPDRAEPIRAIELVKGPDDTAPIVMAVTVELPQ
ncbi:PVC-type heme-binding CxxCH protein [Tundrisphaera sp. TA3]|uniref:PVC-type heme-binding CxxCH protein n=1 Tax=Tundrisphaera sp. TA3 TaxID=3435775 RepID=UPI003EC0758A